MMFYCKECGNEYKKWYGKCPACKEYNTIIEYKNSSINAKSKIVNKNLKEIQIEKLQEVQIEKVYRKKTNIKELDRVLGGGLVKGSLALVGGSPGVGKSTLIMQCASNIAEEKKTLYVSGEESVGQIKIRAQRIVDNIPENLYIVNLKNIEYIKELALKHSIEYLIIDSIQTMETNENNNISGSVSQLKECTLNLMYFAKENNITILMIGHITKDGEIAGPKLLEHMVDVVMYLENENNTNYKILRSKKNRFGKVGEVGIFEMKESGMLSIDSISNLENSENNIEGISLGIISEGNRNFIIEVQSLIVPVSFGYPKRITQGYDNQRMNMFIGLLHKRLNIDFTNYDCYLNVSLNFRTVIKTLDLAVIVSMISSKKNIVIPRDRLYIGEVSLTGEIKKVDKQIEKIEEAVKLGFKEVYCNMEKNIKVEGIKIIDIKDVTSLL